jgi:hypothetical protein
MNFASHLVEIFKPAENAKTKRATGTHFERVRGSARVRGLGWGRAMKIFLRIASGALALSLLAAEIAPRSAAQCGGLPALGGVRSVSGNPFQAEVITTRSPGTPLASPLLNQKPEIVALDS